LKAQLNGPVNFESGTLASRGVTTLGAMADTFSKAASLADLDYAVDEVARRARIDMLLVTITARLIGYAYSSGEHQAVLWIDAHRALADLEQEVQF
jgi:ABC-type Co2+ transport system permease subunit